MKRLAEGGERLAGGDMEHPVDTTHMYRDLKEHGEHLNSIQTGMAKAVAESVKSERFKTELITNVSHDIKTPLTSIINYVDLLEKEELSNETAEGYLEVLERQSNRLKKLIEDLIEASKASTGNLAVHLEKLEAGRLCGADRRRIRGQTERRRSDTADPEAGDAGVCDGGRQAFLARD